MRSARPGFALLALLGALAALASGCGGGGKSSSAAETTPTESSTTTSASGRYSDYELRMQELGVQLARVLEPTARDVAVQNAKPALIRRDLRTAQKRILAAAVSLQQIKPPANVEAQHRQLIAAVREFAAELNGVIKTVSHQNGAQLNQLINGLAGISDMARASDAITKAGYVIVVQPK